MASMKNIMEKIKKVKINPHYDISVRETTEIYMHSKGAFDLLHNAFTAGYMQGEKAAKAKKRKSSIV